MSIHAGNMADDETGGPPFRIRRKPREPRLRCVILDERASLEFLNQACELLCGEATAYGRSQ